MSFTDPNVLMLIKPACSGAIAAAIDSYLNRSRWIEAAKFGTAVALGSLAGDIASKKINTNSRGIAAVAKGLESRVIELGITGASALIVDYQIFNHGFYRSEVAKKLATVIASDMAGEYAANTLLGVV